MRNRGVSKIYVVAGTIIGVVLLMIAVRLIALNVNPEQHHTNTDPTLEVPARSPAPEPAGGDSTPIEGGGTNQSTNPNP